mmetsp:Transcript_114727/g.222846  ORF Transcript_114727/g.222846 Transcript_114727/m.222846 type:complete len:81 (+) Transcript_114727:284-526(+)
MAMTRGVQWFQCTLKGGLHAVLTLQQFGSLHPNILGFVSIGGLLWLAWHLGADPQAMQKSPHGGFPRAIVSYSAEELLLV